ncbi:rhodanese-like domain-containing protein [Rhodobacteraceae bacterium NNCM2]|nr:rhodanese-like domain-containing protein [Coraliihabitans acroporae]
MSGAQVMLDQVDPADAFQTLSQSQDALLIDVRTRAEWQFVGLPDLSAISKETALVEWVQFPQMTHNASFVEEVENLIEAHRTNRLFFICRSGARSLSAAQAIAASRQARGETIHCTNVMEGFEGDLDTDGHRGKLNGWKARGLPWKQG